MSEIVLATVNARYVHASLGLRYLLANMGELQAQTEVVEFILGAKPADMVETLLARKPRVVGLGVYIWNAEDTAKIVALLKRVAPGVVVVLGGPEVSYEIEEQPCAQVADYVITGWGDTTFAKLCRALLAGVPPQEKILAGEQPPLDSLAPPYALYTDEDIAQRFLYVEASRGCPFKCEFCLSALDKTAWPFDLDRFLCELDSLHRRGARHFRFVDRTFNLKASAGVRILEFFLERIDARLFVHFEVIPDHLPDALKEKIVRFPPGSLQFEIGIQTWNPEVQALISRRQDDEKAEQNIAWLRANSHALIHADLIAGLPGEDLQSFGRGFDRLLRLRPHEIQVGILKRLRGTPIARHTKNFDMRYNPDPPYEVLATDRIDFSTMQRLARFARYWEMVGNSGRFRATLALLLGSAPFERFMHFSDWLFETTRKTHAIALERLFDLLYVFLSEQAPVDRAQVIEALLSDYAATGAKGKLAFMTRGTSIASTPKKVRTPGRAAVRQARHARP